MWLHHPIKNQHHLPLPIRSPVPILFPEEPSYPILNHIDMHYPTLHEQTPNLDNLNCLLASLSQRMIIRKRWHVLILVHPWVVVAWNQQTRTLGLPLFLEPSWWRRHKRCYIGHAKFAMQPLSLGLHQYNKILLRPCRWICKGSDRIVRCLWNHCLKPFFDT